MARYQHPRENALKVGKTAPGAKLHFYEPGTTTPKNTTDAGGTPLTNPVIADENGIFEAIYGDGYYKVVKKDNTDATLWTEDNIEFASELTERVLAVEVVDVNGTDSLYAVTGAFDDQQVLVGGYYSVGDGGGGLFYYDTSSSATDDGGAVIKPTAVSGNGRWLRNFGGEPPSVLHFGAQPQDSTADSLSAFDNALSHLAGQGGGRLRVPVVDYAESGSAPSGETGVTNYYVSGTVAIPNKCSVVGDGKGVSSITALASPGFSGSYLVRLGEGFATDGLSQVQDCILENIRAHTNENSTVIAVYSDQINENAGCRKVRGISWKAPALQIATATPTSQGSPKNFELLYNDWFSNDPTNNVTYCVDLEFAQARAIIGNTCIGDGFDRFQSGGTDTDVSKACMRIAGYPTGDIIGTHCEGGTDGIFVEEASGLIISGVTAGGGTNSGAVTNLVHLDDDTASTGICLMGINANGINTTNVLLDSVLNRTIGRGTGELGSDQLVLGMYFVGSGDFDNRTVITNIPRGETRVDNFRIKGPMQFPGRTDGNDHTDIDNPLLCNADRRMFYISGDTVLVRMPSYTDDNTWTDQLDGTIQETSTTTGVGTYDLAGATGGHNTFVDRAGDGAIVQYRAWDGTDFEEGIGTVTDAATDTLSRDSIIKSSNADAAVNWGAGPTITMIPRIYIPSNEFVMFKLLWTGSVSCTAFTLNGDGVLFEADGTIGTNVVDANSGDTYQSVLRANTVYEVVMGYFGSAKRIWITGDT